MAGEGCSPDLMREHEQRITTAQNTSDHAHNRIDGVVELIKDFTTEMRESNANMSKLIGEIKVLANDIGHIAAATHKHEEDISEIKESMGTKEAVDRMQQTIQGYNDEHRKGMDAVMSEHRKGMDAIMSAVRETDDKIEVHKREPAEEALKREKSFKKWLFAAVGAIIASQYLPELINWLLHL